jgi:hypothetical protein
MEEEHVTAFQLGPLIYLPRAESPLKPHGPVLLSTRPMAVPLHTASEASSVPV